MKNTYWIALGITSACFASASFAQTVTTVAGIGASCRNRS